MDRDQTGVPGEAIDPAAASPAGPVAMREHLRQFVFEVHRSYLAQARDLDPRQRSQLPLIARRPFSVAVAAARQLHLIATNDDLPARREGEVAPGDELAEIGWTVRFFDSASLPELAPAFTSDDELVCVRNVLGIGEVIYHLSIAAGGGLSDHHAHHAGMALGNRDAAGILRRFPRSTGHAC